MSLELNGANYYYFPYSVGVIWSYANCDPLIAKNYQLKEFFYRKEPIQDIVNRLDNPSVFGLSSYIWNTNYNQELAIAVKNKWPQCKIIMGGANVPDHDYSYFESRPYVDFIVHQEGEISFLAILKNLLNELDINSVPGISFNDNGKRIHTGPGHRINDLSQIPSPYTSGMFDNILKDAQENGRIMQGILETNRGCPFKCTFCDWGGTTFSKIKMFDISRVQEEIDWFAQNKIEYINGRPFLATKSFYFGYGHTFYSDFG